MASLERRNKSYRVVFMYQGKKHSYSMRTNDRSVAESLLGGVEKTLMRLENNLLTIPDDTDVVTFVKNDGVSRPIKKTKQVAKVVILGQLARDYETTYSHGGMESSSLATALMHLRHFERTLGPNFHMQDLTLDDLQNHVHSRQKAKRPNNKPLSPTTLKKEIASLRAVWNWAVRRGVITGKFPNSGLVYPKATEKPPFQTWQEIEQKIKRGASEQQQKELWDSLFLTLPEIDELLAHVEENAGHEFIHPMFCFAAHTGARRSEMLRLEWNDVSFDAETVTLHEKKRAQGKRTTRRVPLSPLLHTVLQKWHDNHPGGSFVFCHGLEVPGSKKKRTEYSELTRDEAHDHFKRTLANSKWKVLRGWHVFRHSFISNCVAKGIDQRIIDEWVGHQTDEMRKRYRHLIPSEQKKAMELVFGGQ